MVISIRDNPYMDISAAISRNLTDWMNASPALDTLKKVEAKSGLGFSTIRRAKNGDGNVTVETLEALAAAFGRSAMDLITPPVADSPKTRATTANENSAPYPVDPTALVREAAELITLWSALSPDLQAHIADLIRKAASSDLSHTPAAPSFIDATPNTAQDMRRQNDAGSAAGRQLNTKVDKWVRQKKSPVGKTGDGE